jgi:hypothetical protein
MAIPDEASRNPARIPSVLENFILTSHDYAGTGRNITWGKNYRRFGINTKWLISSLKSLQQNLFHGSFKTPTPQGKTLDGIF